MVLFPAAAAAISAIFAVMLLRRYRSSRRIAHFAWGIALAQFALASAIVAAGITGGWDPTLYRGFWLFGAMLNVPWLALGSIALVSKPLVTRAAMGVVLGLSIYGLIAVMQASPIDTVLRGEDGIPQGREVWGKGATILTLARWYSISAWLIVVGIAAWTSRKRGDVAPPRARVRGNALIAIGVSLVAVGGFALGRIGRGSAFSVTLAVGVAVMFAGFLFASRPADQPDRDAVIDEP